jgi:hypothetical protein
MSQPSVIPSSFRDPAGFVIEDEGIFKRVVTPRGVEHYRRYMESGLHAELVQNHLVLDHFEAQPLERPDCSELLIPEQIPYISYAYEWTFDQLRDAALLTLEVQERALARGMTLKDASSFNVQFRGSTPVFIDTLSFEILREAPWVAYEQFCRQFYAPLALISYCSPHLGRYLQVDLEGLPLRLVSRLLPASSLLRSGPLLHILLHARAQAKNPASNLEHQGRSAADVRNLVASLRRAIMALRPPRYAKGWTEYYPDGAFYSAQAQASKRCGALSLAERAQASRVFDLGANTGLYAKELAERGATCIAFDSDPGCVSQLYLEQRGRPGSRILPLVIDLVNPSPALGFGLNATLGMFERGEAGLVLCLGLLHHLRITANLPLGRVAEVLARLGRWLLIEFVPLTDPAVRTLTRRIDDFADLHPEAFLAAFRSRFVLQGAAAVADTDRVLYLFERRACWN